MRLQSILLLSLCLSKCLQGKTINIGLEANWTASDFSIQLIEAASLYNESLYIQSTHALFLGSEDVSDWDDDFDDDNDHSEGTDQSDWPLTDRQSYEKVTLHLSPIDTGFLNLNLVNQMSSPRIQAHFNYFENVVEPTILPMVEKQCAQDSFGQTLENPSSVWVKYGSRIYCSEEDLYALQLNSFSEELEDFDRVIGENDQAPILILYGQPKSDRFAPIFRTLVKFASTGNLRFAWRYIPLSSQRLPLYGYGITYAVQEKESAIVKDQGQITSFEKFLAATRLKPVREQPCDDDLVDVAYKATALILKSAISKQLALLSDFVQNAPLFVPFLAKSSSAVTVDTVKEAALQNERIGASSDMVGISINGATVHRLETDLPHIIEKLKFEVQLVNDMNELGFSTSQAKAIFSKNALRSAVKESEYERGSHFNRFSVHKDVYSPTDSTSGGVVFFNDIEVDSNYELLPTDSYEVYVQNADQIRAGQVPPLRENVHDLIFVVNFSDRDQLRVFFTLSKIILDKGIPQQIGILPLVYNDRDREIAAYFYHLIKVGEIQEAMALLYKFYDSNEENEQQILDLVDLPSHKFDLYNNYKKTLANFDISEPSIVVNGVIHSLRASDWQTKLVEQISSDVKSLRAKIWEGLPGNDRLKDILHRNSRSKRNIKVIPQNPANIRYKRVTKELVENSVSFQKSQRSDAFGPTFWLIGDFNSQLIIRQFKEILKYMKSNSGMSSQVRILNTAIESTVLDDLKSKFDAANLKNSDIDQIIELIGDFQVQSVVEPDLAKLQVLKNNHIQLHSPTFLLNSRYSKIDRVLDANDLKLMVSYEFDQRLSFLEDFTSNQQHQFQGSLQDVVTSNYDALTWFDLATSVVTSSIFLEDSVVRSDFGRFDFSSLNFQNLIDLTGYDSNKPADVLVVIDPLDQHSQKLTALAHSLRDISFVNMLILIQPFSRLPKDLNVNQFYVSNFILSNPKFDSAGTHTLKKPVEFKTSSKFPLRADVDAPVNWQCFKGAASEVFDLDRIVSDVNANFTLGKLIVDASVRDVATARHIPGLAFSASSVHAQTLRLGYSVQTNGYCQLQLEPGLWSFLLSYKKEGDNFSLLSGNENKYEINDEPVSAVNLPMYSLYGKSIHVRIKATTDSEIIELQNKKRSESRDQHDINIFCIPRDFVYEEFFAAMMKDVMAHTGKSVKFWILENFLSRHLTIQLPELALTYNFDYEFVSYKWPLWIRQQNDRSRQIAAYKALFLDVLFPESIQKLIVLDVDLAVQADLYKLVELDLHGHVYAFAQMCEDRPDSEKFWHQGYWKDALKDELNYHSSSLFVVDLVEFKARQAGELLRRHYQKLSSDPKSLVILDQDLFNNLQRAIPIYSLPSVWNWAPSWCDQKQRDKANIIQFEIKDLSDSEAYIHARQLSPGWEQILSSSTYTSSSTGIVHDEF